MAKVKSPGAGKRECEGIACPRCGCCHHYTLETRKSRNKLRRRRECRYCGVKFTTFEEVVDTFVDR